jgi:hypothetical protein
LNKKKGKKRKLKALALENKTHAKAVPHIAKAAHIEAYA